ncbi:alpha/beta hydrolase family esterase [Azotobacter chroococcum]|uniref:alpha/beta hydrolase family esterase n=1 Tax=Azotobacter chroococcum TaxID=353 RepID=UPI0018DFDEF7|nr:PHB depolymerase family esterase [Azotobacter chroococcum]
MKQPAPYSLAMLACIVSLLAMPGFAQGDESTRLSLRERWMQRQSDDSATDAPLTQPGDFTFTLRHDGLLRTYRLHVPASYSAARPTPLLVALHGGGGSMDHQVDDARYGLIGKSEREGFILVFPNGFSRLRSGKLATWNAGECCGAARDRQVDDVGFIRQVVAKVARQMTIDRHRIYAAGMSNGGMMAYRLACEMADVFRAVASVAGCAAARRRGPFPSCTSMRGTTPMCCSTEGPARCSGTRRWSRISPPCRRPSRPGQDSTAARRGRVGFWTDPTPIASAIRRAGAAAKSSCASPRRAAIPGPAATRDAASRHPGRFPPRI